MSYYLMLRRKSWRWLNTDIVCMSSLPFVVEALRHNAPLELINHPRGQHAFDLLDDVPLTRYILRRTLEFFSHYLWEREPDRL